MYDFSGFWYICRVIQPSPLSDFRSFSSSQQEPLSLSHSFSFSLQPLAATNLLSVSKGLLVLGIHTHGIIQYMVRLLSLGMFSRFIHVSMWRVSVLHSFFPPLHSFLLLNSNKTEIIWMDNIFLSIHQLMAIVVVFTLGLLWILWTFVYKIQWEHMLSVPGVEVLSHTVTHVISCLHFVELPDCSKGAAPFAIPPAMLNYTFFK